MKKLKIKNMTKSATGTLKEPKKSSGKRGFNRAITQQSWGLFFEMLKYKAKRKCSCCGHISKENRKSQDKFVCTACGIYGNNASLKIAV